MASSSDKYDESEFVPERDDEAMMDDTDYRYVKSFQQYVCFENDRMHNRGSQVTWRKIIVKTSLDNSQERAFTQKLWSRSNNTGICRSDPAQMRAAKAFFDRWGFVIFRDVVPVSDQILGSFPPYKSPISRRHAISYWAHIRRHAISYWAVHK